MVEMRIRRIFALSACALQLSVAQHVGVPTNDLDKVSIDELFSVQVTSVGRKAQKLSKAPAAVFVLTAEDIRRSGATCTSIAFSPSRYTFHSVWPTEWMESSPSRST